MQSDDKIQATLVFLMILQIMGLAFVVILLSNNAFAQTPQTLHDRTLYEVVKQTPESEINSQIDVGAGPIAIAINPFTNTVYVANDDSNSTSVISGENNTKVGEDVPVGFDPRYIAINSFSNTVYVANFGANSVSVISGENNTKIKEIPVGDSPIDIAINPFTNTVYVANRFSNSTSVISGENNTKIKEIPVGDSPIDIAINEDTNTVYVANDDSNSTSVISGENNTKVGEDVPVGNVGDSPIAIAINEDTNTVYVANQFSNSVSVIDGVMNKVVAGIMLNVSPFNSGYIECDRLISPTAQYFYVWSGSECIAKPNKGFEFLSWEENLKNNSTQVLKVSHSASILDSIADFFYIKLDEPEAKLNITKFGSFTANFKELPPPLPTEYWTTLFTVVVTALIGSWLTPTLIGWRKAKKQGRRLDYYHQEVRNLYNDDKLDMNDISKLDILKNDIAYTYSRGKINKEQYEELMKDISIRYEEIFKKEIDFLNHGKNKNIDESRLYDLRKSIEDAYLKGKMNQQHYTNLVNNISMLYQEVFKKEIDSLNSVTNNEDKIKLLDKLHSDIEDAYSKEKVTEKHYNLLKEKISNYEKSRPINS